MCKTKRFFALVLLCALLLVGCGGHDLHTQTAQYRIMFIPKSQISSFWRITIEGFQTAIAEYNEYGIVCSTAQEEDVEGQIDIVYSAIAEDYHAIVISALSYERLAQAVQAAIDSGVKVIVIDSDVNVAAVSARISTDNYKAGYEMGEKTAQLMGYAGDVGVLGFDVTTENLEQRINGFVDALSTYEAVHVVATEETISTHEDAKRGTEYLMNTYPELDAIASFNEIITVAMGESIEEHGREDLIAVGFDNNSRVVSYLEKGVLDGIVIQNQFAMGYLGAQYAIDALDGKEITQPIVDTGVQIVTRGNLYAKEIQPILFPFEIDEE